jgi:hypothetical protein
MKELHDVYKCVIPAYKGGVAYNIGDTMMLPAGTVYEGNCFVLVEKAPVPEKKTPKKKKPLEDEG